MNSSSVSVWLSLKSTLFCQFCPFTVDPGAELTTVRFAQQIPVLTELSCQIVNMLEYE